MTPLHLCVIAKAPIEQCPPLLRMLRHLLGRGHRADVFCVGGEGRIPDLPEPGPDVIVSPAAPSRCKPLKPLREIRRLAGNIRRHPNRTRWDLAVAYDPYALLAAHRSGVARQIPLAYYSAELWDHPKHWPQRWAERTSRKDVAGVIACQEDRLDLVRQNLRTGAPGIVIPNSCYDYLPQLSDANDPDSQETSGRVIFSYQGSSHVENRCLRQAVEAFGCVDEDVQLRMQLVGDPENIRTLERLIARTAHPEHFEILGYVPYGEHFRASASADAALMLYRSDVSLNFRYCAPNKLYEYPMLALPVLCSDQTHLRRSVEGEGFGLCVCPTDPQDIARGIRALLDPEKREAMSRRARRWFVTRGRYDLAGQRLEHWLAALAGKGESLKKAG
jgi:glycosyltransferase involved in cell wall biosynthesis